MKICETAALNYCVTDKFKQQDGDTSNIELLSTYRPGNVGSSRRVSSRGFYMGAKDKAQDHKYFYCRFCKYHPDNLEAKERFKHFFIPKYLKWRKTVISFK